MSHKHCMTWNMARNTEKREKFKMHTVGPGILKKKLKNVDNEKCTLYDLEYSKKH